MAAPLHQRDGGSGGPARVAAAELYAVTREGLIIVESEQPPQPGMLVFAVNVTCVDRCIVRRVTVVPDSQDPATAQLVVDLEIQRLKHRLTFSLGAGAADALTKATRGLPASR
jgi:hypothetical protein